MEKEPKIRIFVAHHKPGYIYEDDVYVPIQVGKKNAEVDLGIIGDDTGDNISEKNDNYAELTAQYWVWKNYDLRDVDYVGFCHYRRYMTYCYKPNIFNYIFAKNFYSPLENKSKLLWRWIALKEYHCLMKYNKNKLSKNAEGLKKYMSTNIYDIYMPKKTQYIWGKILSIIGKKHGSLINFGNFNTKNILFHECLNLFLKKYTEQKEIIDYFENGGDHYFGWGRHLFIMKKDLYFQYMKWLFDYLFDLEKLIKEKHLDIKTHWAGKNDGRFMGIFSESLINYRLAYQLDNKDIKVSSEANTLMFADYYL